MTDELPKVKAKCLVSYFVICPHCNKHNKYDDRMSGEGDQLLARLKQILRREDGETNVQCCCEWCRKEFIVEAFLF